MAAASYSTFGSPAAGDGCGSLPCPASVVLSSAAGGMKIDASQLLKLSVVGVARSSGSAVGVGVAPAPGVPKTLTAGAALPVGVGVSVGMGDVGVGVTLACGDGSGVAAPGAGS